MNVSLGHLDRIKDVPDVVDRLRELVRDIELAFRKVQASGGSGAGLSDTDYGDVTVSGTGTVMTIDSDVLSSVGRTLVSQATQALMRTTGLGLGTLSTQSGTFSGTSSGTNTGDVLNAPLLGLVGFTPGGRLTLTSATAVTTADVTGTGTLYYTPYLHNRIRVWDGALWQYKVFAESSLALTLTSGKNYDVFLDDDVTTLSLSSAWTNDTTRADALATQDSVTVLSSDHTKLWLGTIRASGSNTTEDSGGGSTTQVGGKRFVWNRYNAVSRNLFVIDATDNWTYTTDTWRQANGASGNKVEWVSGVAETLAEAALGATASVTSNSARAAKVGIGADSTTAPTGTRAGAYITTASGTYGQLHAAYRGMPGLGYHYLAWLEKGADGSAVFLGDNGGDGQQGGLYATVMS